MPRIAKIIPVMSYPTDSGSPAWVHEGTADTSRDSHTDNMGRCMKQPPFRICKPLVMTMTLFGLLHLTHEQCVSKKWVSAITKTYSMVILLLVWLNFFRFFGIYGEKESFGTFLFLKIIIHIFYLMCAVNCSVSFKACRCDNRFREFLTRWLKLTRTNRGNNVVAKEHLNASYMKYMSRSVFVFLFIGWVVFLLNLVFSGYLLFNTTLLDATIYPMPLDHRYTFLVKCIGLVLQMYLTATWVFTLSLFFLMCSVVYREFENFDQDFRAAIATDCEILCEIETFRCRHQEISRTVETADNTLKAFNISGVGLSMCIGMLVLYNIIWQDGIFSDPWVLISHIFWLFGSFAYLFVVAFGGGYLNHMAHAPLKAIHDIKVDKTSREFSLQLNIFLNKLTGEPIGLTAMDLFVIDKPTILTILGAFITYFIVLVQFQQPSSSTEVSSTCNCTEILLNSTLQCSAIL